MVINKIKQMTMKTKILSAFALIFLSMAGCKKAKFGDPIIMAAGTEESPIVKFTVEGTPSEYSVTAVSSHKATTDMSVLFELDTAAVGRYNTEHHTNYYAVPEAAIDITNLATVIKAGSAASTPVSVKVVSTSPLIDGRSYVIPLTIKSVSGGDMSVLESSRTIFLRISRVINFNAVAMNNSAGPTSGSPGTRGRINASALFDTDNPEILPNFTFEIKNMVYGFRGGDGNTNPQPIQTLIHFTNLAENSTIGLRYGELGNPSNSLQLFGRLGSVFVHNFNTMQWYTISITYDGSTGRIYLDGNMVGELTAALVMEFSRINLGQNWGGYDTRQYFNGRVGEIRVWNRALTSAEIKLNMCGADPNANGLLAYWKMNEGQGHIFYNSASSGAKYDMDWSKVYWDNAGNGTLVQADKSQYVTWTDDEYNKCSQ